MAWKQRHVYLNAPTLFNSHFLLQLSKVCFFFVFCRHINHSVHYVSSERKALTLFTKTTTSEAVILSVRSLRVIYIRVTHQSLVETETALLDGPWMLQTSDDMSRTYRNQYGEG